MNNAHFTPPILGRLKLSKLLIVVTLFFSAINFAKAAPNVEAAIISITNNSGACGDPATVVAGLIPPGIPSTWQRFNIESIEVYVRDEKAPGMYYDRLIASAGRQPDWQESVTFNNVYGIGLLKTIITFVVDDTVNGGANAGTWTYESDLYEDEVLVALQNPNINSITISGATGGTNPYDLKSCAGDNYELEFDIDYTFGLNNTPPTATFEIIEIASCGGADISVVESYSFNESSVSDPFLDEFLDDMNTNFKSFVQNNTGLYRIRLTMGGSTYCGSGDTKQICVEISDVPTFDKLYLIQNDNQSNTPLDTIPAPNSFPAAQDTIGGFSAGLWAQLSSSDYHYYRFRLEYDPLYGGGTFQTIPLLPIYSNNNTNVGGTLNVQFNTMLNDPGNDILMNNFGAYRVFLIVGVYGCEEDSTAGYFFVNENWRYKSSEARTKDDTNEDSNVSIYPSPANELLTITHGYTKANPSYLISDLQGKTIMEGKLSESETSLIISNIPNGVYIIRLIDQNGGVIHRQKILKQ